MATDVFPFLRWAGGKRWLGPLLAEFIAMRLSPTGTYFEPFLGSGAVFFAVQPKRAVLSDLNEDLILTYREVAEQPQKLVRQLRGLPSDPKTYYMIRQSKPRSTIGRATRFIYLNRNCYRGLYRENRKGEFNVPYGGGDRNHLGMCGDDTLSHCSNLLASRTVRLRSGDFEKFIRRAGSGDVVYCDPTYRKVTREHFDRFGKTIFSWKDQRRLAEVCAAAFERGATIIISNACCEELKPLYPAAVVMRAIRNAGISSPGVHVARDEYLLVLDPKNEVTISAY